MLRCASSFVVAAYVYVRLTPQDSRALPAELFAKPARKQGFFRLFTSSLLFAQYHGNMTHPFFYRCSSSLGPRPPTFQGGAMIDKDLLDVKDIFINVRILLRIGQSRIQDLAYMTGRIFSRKKEDLLRLLDLFSSDQIHHQPYLLR